MSNGESFAQGALMENGGPRTPAADEVSIAEDNRDRVALLAGEARYRALCSLASDFFWETDVLHRVCLYIPGKGHKGALPRGSQIGKTRWETPYLKPDAAGWQRHHDHLDVHLPFRDFEFSRKHVDGYEAYFSISGEPMFDRMGAFIGYRGVGRDITATKRAETQRLELESQLREAQKLASIGQLAAGVAHEINNPVGFVQANIGALHRYLDNLFSLLDIYAVAEELLPADSPMRSLLTQAKQQADLDFLREDVPTLLRESQDGIGRVRKIVHDLKDFSRVERHAEWELSDVRRGIDSTLNIIANEIKYRATVVRRYQNVPEIECLPSQINQVFLNLLVNAAQSIESPMGTITIAVSQTGDDMVRVDIADTGTGIKPEHIPHLFEPFFTTKPVGKGTGLGLSLSYGIVQKHQGRIEVQSEPGQGTTFSVLLPVRKDKN